MFKDARLQERLMDEVHAAEFDLEDISSVPVGSLLSDQSLADNGSFQRIADDDDGGVAPSARARELEAPVFAVRRRSRGRHSAQSLIRTCQ